MGTEEFNSLKQQSEADTKAREKEIQNRYQLEIDEGPPRYKSHYFYHH